MKAAVLATAVAVSALGARAVNEDFREFTLPRFSAWAAKSSFHVFKGVGHAYREAFKDPVWLKFLVSGD